MPSPPPSGTHPLIFRAEGSVFLLLVDFHFFFLTRVRFLPCGLRWFHRCLSLLPTPVGAFIFIMLEVHSVSPLSFDFLFHLPLSLPVMAHHARVVVAGATSYYNTTMAGTWRSFYRA